MASESNTAMSSNSECGNLTELSSHTVNALCSSQHVPVLTWESVPAFVAWDGPGWSNAWDGAGCSNAWGGLGCAGPASSGQDQLTPNPTRVSSAAGGVLPPAQPHQRDAHAEPEADPPQAEIEIVAEPPLDLKHFGLALKLVGRSSPLVPH